VRFTAVHMPRTLGMSSSSLREGVMQAGAKPRGLYVLAGAQVLSSILLVVASASGFESSLGDSQTESLGMVVALTGLILAAGVLLSTSWARLGTLVWICVLMALQLALYARDDSPSYVVMALSLVQVIYLNQPDVKRSLASRSSAGLDS
jgi:flagellar biosynthesis protein FliP